MKVNNKLQLATFFISMFMLTACGGGGDSAATPPEHFIAMFAISILLVKKLVCGEFIALKVKYVLLIITI
jgi:hypothetical protein